MPKNPPLRPNARTQVLDRVERNTTPIAVALAAASVTLGLTLEPALVGLGLVLMYTAGRVGR